MPIIGHTVIKVKRKESEKVEEVSAKTKEKEVKAVQDKIKKAKQTLMNK